MEIGLETTGQAGLRVPDAREAVVSETSKYPTLNEGRAERRSMMARTLDIEEWKGCRKAGGSEAVRRTALLSPQFPFNRPQGLQLFMKMRMSDPPCGMMRLEYMEKTRPDGGANTTLTGPISILRKLTKALMTSTTNWYDPPTIPEFTTTSHQGAFASNGGPELRYQKASDAVSIKAVPGQATWGDEAPTTYLVNPACSNYATL